MKSSTIAVLLAAMPLAAAAQDPVKVDPAHYKVVIDNAAVRVLKVDYAVGALCPARAPCAAIRVAE